MEEKLVISCGSCRAEIRLRVTEQNLAIRFCPKCGAAVRPVRSKPWDASVVHEVPPQPEEDLMDDRPRQIPRPGDTLPLPDTIGFAPDEEPAIPRFDLSIDARPTPPPPRPAPKRIETDDDEPITLRREAPTPRPRVDVPPRAKEDIVRENRERSRRDHGGSLAGRPLWDAVYTFPFRLNNLRVLIMLVISFMLLALMAAGLHGVYEMLFGLSEEGDLSSFSGLVQRGAIPVFVCLFVLTIFLSLHQAAAFLRIIEDTAAGIDEVAWSKDPWFEHLTRWLFLGWVFLVSAAGPAFFVLVVSRVVRVPPALSWIVTLGLAWLIAPIVLLSTMSAGAFYILVQPRLLIRLASKPMAAGFLYANAFLFVVPCALLGYAVIGEYHLILLPFLGPIWAIALVVYARVLGRVGFELMQE
jgi:hypothetical protein